MDVKSFYIELCLNNTLNCYYIIIFKDQASHTPFSHERENVSICAIKIRGKAMVKTQQKTSKPTSLTIQTIQTRYYYID